MKKIFLVFIFTLLIADLISSCSVSRGNYGGCPTNNKNFFRR
ncbi:MAG: hypothetical protein ACR2FN_08670 [Chitinophagaceae bacterium]